MGASSLDEQTIFTFRQPVQVPGRVLAAGKYLFKLDKSEGALGGVEIESLDRHRVYGIFAVNPVFRLDATTAPLITFEERTAGAPQAIKAWFYPGDHYGNGFIYSNK
jgi:hypothetical protein